MVNTDYFNKGDKMTRQEAIERLADYFEYEDGLSADKDTQKAYKMAIEALKVEPKHGRWIEEDDAIIHGHCSSCGWVSVWQETDVLGMNYCPNCGAKMDL